MGKVRVRGGSKHFHDKPKVGSSHKAPVGGSGEGDSRGTDGLGNGQPNQVVPHFHKVPRVPGDAKEHDPNFGHKVRG